MNLFLLSLVIHNWDIIYWEPCRLLKLQSVRRVIHLSLFVNHNKNWLYSRRKIRKQSLYFCFWEKRWRKEDVWKLSEDFNFQYTNKTNVDDKTWYNMSWLESLWFADLNYSFWILSCKNSFHCVNSKNL